MSKRVPVDSGFEDREKGHKSLQEVSASWKGSLLNKTQRYPSLVFSSTTPIFHF